MKVKVNKYIPFHGFVAMAFYNILIWRKEYEYKMNVKPYFERVYNHECIHEAQMRDFCRWIPIGGTIFYVVYLFEWLFRILFTKDFMSFNAYRNLTFEREAKSNETNENYLLTRRPFSQWRNK